MAKRLSKNELSLVIILAIVFIPLYLIFQIFEILGPFISIVVIGVIIWALVRHYNKKREERFAYLYGKYKDNELVDKIMNKSFWQGQTVEQLIDSLGEPKDIDQKILKTKTKEIWKYFHEGGNRYRLRITLENGIVVGWDQR